VKQLVTAPKQNIQIHLNSFQIQKSSNFAQTTFWCKEILHCNVWVNFHIFQKCTGGLSISKQKINKREKKETEIRKRKRIKLDWTKCTVHWPSPAGPPHLPPSPCRLAHGQTRARAGAAPTRRRHRRYRSGEGIRRSPSTSPFTPVHSFPSPSSLSLDLTDDRARPTPCRRRARGHRPPLAAAECQGDAPTSPTSTAPTNGSRGAPQRLHRAAPFRLCSGDLRRPQATCCY
jgi:hypothetical protein